MSKKQRDQLYMEVVRHQQTIANSPPLPVQQHQYHQYHQQQYQPPAEEQYLQQYANISPYMNPYMNPAYVSTLIFDKSNRVYNQLNPTLPQNHYIKQETYEPSLQVESIATKPKVVDDKQNIVDAFNQTVKLSREQVEAAESQVTPAHTVILNFLITNITMLLG